MSNNFIRGFIVLVIGLLLAVFPSKIADKKGYSGTLFYFYGLFSFLIALIHAASLPDMLDTSKRKYKGKTLGLAVAASLVFLYSLFISCVFKIFDVDALFVMEAILLFLLIFVAVFARKYIFTIIIFGAHVLYMVYNLVRYIILVAQNIAMDNYAGSAITISSFVLYRLIVSAAYIYFAVVIYKHGVKKEKVPANNVMLFTLPSVLLVVAEIVRSGIVNFSFMGDFYSATFYISLLMEIIGILLLGFFYKEDFAYRDAELSEQAADS